MSTENIYNNLQAQLDKVFRHCRQGSHATKRRYREAMRRFAKFLAAEFHLQKIANIAGKHLIAYVQDMQERELAASTVKVEMSAIRFWFDQIPNTRHKLPPNSKLNLELRSFGQDDCTWSMPEFDKMLNLCRGLGREDYVAILILARYAGLRIHENFKVDAAIARDAIRKMEITIVGKGGRRRVVPIGENVKTELEKMLAITKPGDKLFVSNNVATHIAINRLQQFIDEHRPEVQDADSDRPMTAHGLRHSYAVEQYKELTAKGCSDTDACKRISLLLGHSRRDVVRIYLASLKKDGDGHV